MQLNNAIHAPAMTIEVLHSRTEILAPMQCIKTTENTIVAAIVDDHCKIHVALDRLVEEVCAMVCST